MFIHLLKPRAYINDKIINMLYKLIKNIFSLFLLL